MTDGTNLGVSVTNAWPTRSAEAYHRIRQMLFDGAITAGSTLVEARLVRVLEMSRTPVREALHRLEAEGLLLALPHGGYQVVEVSSEDRYNLYMIRAALEGLAAETAASRLTRVDLARLEDLYDEMGEAAQEGRDDDLIRLNREFHQAIAVASGNSHLQEILDNVKGVFERFRTNAVGNSERRAQAHAEHGEIIEALRAKDPTLARQLAETHVHMALRQGSEMVTSD